MFPPNEYLNLFFLSRWAKSLHVVDLPLVPVTTTLLTFLLVK